MKLHKIIFLILISTFIFTSFAAAKDFKAEQPFLITPAGQAMEAMMVKIMADKAGLKFSYEKTATPDALKGNKTLILVSGGSSKGLGAANIDKDQELKRVQTLIDEAQKQRIKIITIHIGGTKRRGKLSDPFNTLAAENSNYLIILKEGDQDKFFKSIAEKKKIPMKYIEKILETGDVLKEIFSAKKK